MRRELITSPSYAHPIRLYDLLRLIASNCSTVNTSLSSPTRKVDRKWFQIPSSYSRGLANISARFTVCVRRKKNKSELSPDNERDKRVLIENKTDGIPGSCETNTVLAIGNFAVSNRNAFGSPSA